MLRRMRRLLSGRLGRMACRFFAAPVALGLVLASQGWSQSPAASPRSLMSKTTITLPIQLDPGARPHLQEVQLYVKNTPESPWVLKERVPPTQTYFVFRAPSDGEYAFSVVTVDKMGRSVPADVNRELPGLVVVVDQSPPSINAHMLETTPVGHVVLCEIQDPNHDTAKTRFSFQTADGVWRDLTSMPGTPEQFCIPAQAKLTGMIRVQATDKAGNTGTREFNLKSMPPAHAGTVPVMPVAPSRGGAGVVMVDPSGGTTHLTPPPGLPKEIIVPVEGSRTSGDLPPSGGRLKDRVEVMTHKLPHTPPYTPRDVVPPAGIIESPGVEMPVRVDMVPPPRDIKVEFPPPPPPLSRIDMSSGAEVVRVETPGKTVMLPTSVERRVEGAATPVNWHILNNTRVFLDYQIDHLGASGVGKVEIWMTRDAGQNWQCIGEDKDLKAPAEFTLPSEGMYGVTLVVSNGRGFGATPPQPGDQPDYWIEVDVTKPQAEIIGVRPSGAEDGSLTISWNARDKKLANEPIDLFFATTREGPWTPIAKGLRNDGNFRWVPPRESAAHAFLRLTARDQAGNIAVCDTLSPVPLDDLSRPRGRVVGVTTAPRSLLPE